MPGGASLSGAGLGWPELVSGLSHGHLFLVLGG